MITKAKEMIQKPAIFFAHVEEAMTQSGLSLSDVLERVHDMGYAAIEFGREHLDHPQDMAKELAAHKLEVSCIYGHFDFGRQSISADAYALVDLAIEMKAHQVMAIPGFYNETSKAGRQREFQNMVDSMTKLTAYGKSKGIQVLMEDFDAADSPFSTLDGLYQLMVQTPDLACAFDTGNFRFTGQDELAAFDKLRPYIKHIHLKDRRYSGSEAERSATATDGTILYASPVGSGEMAIETIIQGVLEDGYEGYFSVEHFDAPDQLAYMKQSIHWLRTHIYQNA